MGVVHEEEYYNEDPANKSSYSRKKTSKGDNSVGAKSPKSKVSSQKKGAIGSPNSMQRNEPSIHGKISKQ